MPHWAEFTACFVLCALADAIAVQWVKAVESRKMLPAAAFAGAIEGILVVVGWLAFVGESWYAAAGMVLGASVGAAVGVRISKG